MFTQYREDTLRRTLENLIHSAPDVKAAVIVNVDGLVVTSYPPTPEDVKNPIGDQSVAATSALILGLAERTLERLAQGTLDRVLIEGEQGAIGVYPCTADAALAVLIAKNARLGLALTAARRTAAEIQSILNTIGQ
jgi:predicted regulator of Ras-like GTPase activity (Roadblock/LC7/MglB family)